MNEDRKSRLLRTSVLVLGAGIAGAWLAPLVARAAGAAATGPTLSYAGTLTQNGAPLTSPQTVTFAFKKNGTVVCTAADLAVTPDPNGQFTVAVPLAGCPTSLFDGRDVKLDISVSGAVAIADQSVTSVPAALYAESAGTPLCPIGYDRDNAVTAFVLCRHGVDEMVRVGTKATAFWIDRYEASVWEFADGTGVSYGASVADYPIPQNGQPGATDNKGFAISKSGVLPSTMITWFQADAFCRASGKRLPISSEWGYAARGTPDPGNSDGQGGVCRTGGGNVRIAGQGTACVSRWGAEDMIGNVPEIINEWGASPTTSATDSRNGNPQPPVMGPGFNDDWTTNLISGGAVDNWEVGVPSTIMRGGGVWEGAGAGIFNLNLSLTPGRGHASSGFRCVIPR